MTLGIMMTLICDNQDAASAQEFFIAFYKVFSYYK